MTAAEVIDNNDGGGVASLPCLGIEKNEVFLLVGNKPTEALMLLHQITKK